MWGQKWRETVWQELVQEWDILIIGGGITGAGIFREAARLGLRVLLVEQRDFGWGTSSRSSKFVHGGLRYLKEGQLGLTRDSVHEREQLLASAPGLVEPIGFLLANYQGDKVGRMVFGAGLAIYDLLALQWSHKYISPAEFQLLAPRIDPTGLKGGYQYHDAQTDDARLVLRVLQEGTKDGNGRAVPLNYVAATELLRDADGLVCGARLHNTISGQSQPVQARVVINATGSQADQLRQQVGGAEKIRPLRGSHLIFHGWRLPVAQVLTFLHPFDQRPVMVFPWEGATMVGTTDVDHPHGIQAEPCISPDEVAYLMAAVNAEFPSLNIQLSDVVATLAGVRPVIGTGKEDPSEESREHVLWHEAGLLTVTGGKLTTFRLIAHDTLKEVQEQFPEWPPVDEKAPALTLASTELLAGYNLDDHLQRRLVGRYGTAATELAAAAGKDEWEWIPGTHFTWAELRWGARAEGVQHLEDLLLRRTRLGLLLPEGGQAHLPRIRAICQAELGWSDDRWQAEEEAYLALWRGCYSLPPLESIPDWRPRLAQIEQETAVTVRRPYPRLLLAVMCLALALVVTAVWWWRREQNNL